MLLLLLEGSSLLIKVAHYIKSCAKFDDDYVVVAIQLRGML